MELCKNNKPFRFKLVSDLKYMFYGIIGFYYKLYKCRKYECTYLKLLFPFR